MFAACFHPTALNVDVLMHPMFRFATVVASDSVGLARVCGPAVASRWLGNVARTFNRCRQSGNLQPADIAMGEGPFRVQRNHATALMTGERVISGIREIWVRDVYLNDDYLKIAPDAVVVDLGANMGNFTMLALAHGDNVRVVSVEPSSERNHLFEQQLKVNGWEGRAVLDQCFLGGRGEAQEELLKDKHFQNAQFVTQEQFLAKHELTHIDFLKCDIEGSEFELLTPSSPILAITRQIAIEVHDFAGDRHKFLAMLQQCGFEFGPVRHTSGDCIALAKRR
jgi:FkbM family methyltransferase